MRIAILCLVVCAVGCKQRPTTLDRPIDRSCEEHSECVQEPTCCPAPCGPAMNKRDLDRVNAFLKEACDPSSADPNLNIRPCPEAGGCISHDYLCLENKCELVLETDPRHPKFIDLSCKTVDDCVPQPSCCESPSCALPMNRDAAKEYAKVIKPDCEASPCPAMSECDDIHQYQCVDNACVRIPESDSRFKPGTED